MTDNASNEITKSIDLPPSSYKADNAANYELQAKNLVEAQALGDGRQVIHPIDVRTTTAPDGHTRVAATGRLRPR